MSDAPGGSMLPAEGNHARALVIFHNATKVWTTASAGSAGLKGLFRSDQKRREAAVGTAGMAEEVGQHIQPKFHAQSWITSIDVAR